MGAKFRAAFQLVAQEIRVKITQSFCIYSRPIFRILWYVSLRAAEGFVTLQQAVGINRDDASSPL